MNKILTNIIFMIIAVVIIVVLGNLFFISTLDTELTQTESTISSKRIELEGLRDKLNNMTNEKPNANSPRLVSIGQEGQIMKLFISSNKAQSPIYINTYDLFCSYFYKPETTNDISNNDNSSTKSENSVENTPMLDENGMPVGAYVQDGDEWKGVEVTPIKITFRQEPKHMSSTLRLLQSLPTNAVRAADFVFDKNLIRGTLVLAFPLNEQ